VGVTSTALTPWFHQAAKLERNLLQKAKEVATLQKNFEIVKTEYNKLKQAKVGFL